MLKIYASRDEEKRLLPILAEFKARVLTNYPIKGHTRKINGKNSYKVTRFPNKEVCIACHGENIEGCAYCNVEGFN